MSLRATYALISRYGATRQVERIGGSSVMVPVMRTRNTEVPLEGDVSQYNVRFFVRHDDLANAGFDLPMRKGDRIHEGSQVHTAQSVEPLYDQDGAVGAYEIRARGH